jgi:hypothetical protein
MIRKFHDAKFIGGPVTLWGSADLHVDDLGVACPSPDLLRLLTMVGHDNEIVWDAAQSDGPPPKLLDVRGPSRSAGSRGSTFSTESARPTTVTSHTRPTSGLRSRQGIVRLPSIAAARWHRQCWRRCLKNSLGEGEVFIDRSPFRSTSYSFRRIDLAIRSQVKRFVTREVERFTGLPSTLGLLQYQSGVAAILAQRAARHSFRHLWDAEVSIYSQWGEDGILDYLCDFLNLVKPRAVEFGAGNFRECNTRFLAEHRSASVVAIDCHEDLTSSVRSMPVNWRSTVIPRQEWITPTNAPTLLGEARKSLGGVDIVSLDIDGNDYWVAESLPLEGVSVVVVEYNPLFGPIYPVTVPRDDYFDRTRVHFSWLYCGASLRAFLNLLSERGFSFLGSNRAGSNAFFVRSSHLNTYPLELPATGDLSRFTDWRARESRDRLGNLDFLNGNARVAVMGELPLVNTITGDRISVLDACPI